MNTKKHELLATSRIVVNPPGLLSRFLRWSRTRRAIPFIKGRVLDYGCGRGYLSQFVHENNYLGVDVNPNIIEYARHINPKHTFIHLDKLAANERFDTVVSLAVIEHVPAPEQFMKSMTLTLAPGGRLILTTPEPSFEKLYEWGTSFRLFSQHAADEHESLLNHKELAAFASELGLRLACYQRFLGGANQLAVYERMD